MSLKLLNRFFSQIFINKNVSLVHGCPTRTIIFYIQWTVKMGKNKFQVDWTSTSSKTTSTKNFNLKRDERTEGQTYGRTNERTHRPENIMPINGA